MLTNKRDLFRKREWFKGFACYKDELRHVNRHSVGVTRLIKMSQKRKRLSIKDKVDVIRACEKEPMSVRTIAEKFNIGKSQASNILSSKDEILKIYLKNGNDCSKRKFPKVQSSVIDSVVYEWTCQVRAKNLPLSGSQIKEKALAVAEELGLKDFSASNGWLEKWRIRHQISYRAICGESASVDDSIVINWFEKVKEICSDYEEKNIFNCDETALFFKALPTKTMALKGEKCSGGKLSKERLTLMLCVNMAGDFEPPLIIGKAANPRCFRGIDVSALNVDWRANRRAWMNAAVMTSWLDSLNKKMKRQKRNILLFLDNAACHPKITLSNVKLIFLPPNTTSKCQPLDQGIIQNFKIYYRKKFLEHLLTNMDNEDSAARLSSTVNVLDAILWIKSSIGEIKPATVNNCFVKAGFVQTEERDDDFGIDPTQETQQLLQHFGPSADCYISIDDDVQTENPSDDIRQLISDGVMQETEEKDDEAEEEDLGRRDDEAEEEDTISASTALKYISQLKKFTLKSNDVVSLALASELQISIANNLAKQPKKQLKIVDYFNKL